MTEETCQVCELQKHLYDLVEEAKSRMSIGKYADMGIIIQQQDSLANYEQMVGHNKKAHKTK